VDDGGVELIGGRDIDGPDAEDTLLVLGGGTGFEGCTDGVSDCRGLGRGLTTSIGRSYGD
jgi:hypothetical protein